LNILSLLAVVVAVQHAVRLPENQAAVAAQERLEPRPDLLFRPVLQ
jgi:hypothetical protein